MMKGMARRDVRCDQKKTGRESEARGHHDRQVGLHAVGLRGYSQYPCAQ